MKIAIIGGTGDQGLGLALRFAISGEHVLVGSRDVKKAENVGKTFTVQGNVQTTLKIGTLSGYRLKDATDSIVVSAQNLPKENTTITVTGILMQDTIFGYYIKANE